MGVSEFPLSMGRMVFLRALLLAPLLAAGCTITEGSLCSDDKPPPPAVPCQVQTLWQNRVAYAADPANGGQMTPGLAGRVYLFGQEIKLPMTGDGGLFVEMFDETHGPPVKVEVWSIDSETLHRLLRHDIIGWGYTVFLPSATWKPGMTKIRLRTCYMTKAKTSLYAENVVTLADTNGIMSEETKHIPLPPPMPVR